MNMQSLNCHEEKHILSFTGKWYCF